MKSWFWLYQNEHFQEMFILIQPPTPLYQMEHFQDLFILLQIKSLNFCCSGKCPSQSITEASRPTITGVWGAEPPSETKV